MAYVVTRPCLGTKDRSCVEVCPVDCFYDIQDPKLNEQYAAGPAAWSTEGNDESKKKKGYGMLMIHPDECINCGACETECPVEAIYEDTGVPEQHQAFVKLNSDKTMAMSDEELDSHRITSKD